MEKLSLEDSDCDDKPKALAGILKEPKYESSYSMKSTFTQNKGIKGEVFERQQYVPDSLKQVDKSLKWGQDKTRTQTRYRSDDGSISAMTMAAAATTGTSSNVNTNCDRQQPLQSQPKNHGDKPFSLSNLISKRQALQERENLDSPLRVEADIDFCCMTAEDYEKALVEEDADDESSCSTDEASSMFENEEDNFFVSPSQLGEQQFEGLSKMEQISQIMFGDLEPEDTLPAPEPRPFLKIWQALSSWASPLAMELIMEWKNVGAEWDYSSSSPSRLYDRSDIGSSRCNGLMSLLKMHLPSALIELGINRGTDGEKSADKKLGELARAFDFSEPMAKFDDPRMWKVLTIILLEIAMIRPPLGHQHNCNEPHLPFSAREVGITSEEYRYLCSSAMTNLS